MNPAHLEPKSTRENVLAGEGITARNAVKTRCSKGHEFTEENTYVDSRGWRQCRECGREAAREYQRRKRETIPA